MNERLARMTQAAKSLNLQMQDGSLVRGVLREHSQDIMEQQHIQLLEGKGSDGNDLRPYYTEDVKPHGYFKTQQTASNYMAWKETLSYPYSVTRIEECPSVLIECGYVSNLEECRILQNSKHQDSIASAIANGIRDFFAAN